MGLADSLLSLFSLEMLIEGPVGDPINGHGVEAASELPPDGVGVGVASRFWS